MTQQRVKRHTRYDLEGNATVTETPWTANDYQTAIEEQEKNLTQRCIREALQGNQDALDRVAEIETEIATLRDEMKAL